MVDPPEANDESSCRLRLCAFAGTKVLRAAALP